MSDDTVAIDKNSLAILISEAESTVDSIDDKHWHENEGQRVKDAIDAGYRAFDDSDEVHQQTVGEIGDTKVAVTAFGPMAMWCVDVLSVKFESILEQVEAELPTDD